MPTDYRAVAEVPELVKRTLELAEQLGFKNACLPEVGRLLRLLVAQAGSGTIGEIGTGCGVGAAWMLAGLRADQQFVSIDHDPQYQRSVSQLCASPNARFLLGDWRNLLQHAPFQLLFADAGEAKDAGADEVVQAMAPGGLIVLDDFTPEALRLESYGMPDTRREFWLNDSRLVATEILTTPRTSAILAVRTA